MIRWYQRAKARFLGSAAIYGTGLLGVAGLVWHAPHGIAHLYCVLGAGLCAGVSLGALKFLDRWIRRGRRNRENQEAGN